MPSLSDKLKSLGVQVGARHMPQSQPKLADPYAIEQMIPGQFESTPHGQTFVTKTTFPALHQHGRVSLETSVALDIIAAWAKEPDLLQLALDKFAFVDTETSGLAGGTGTYAFLVGVARFDQGEFQLAQFFMRDPGEEAAQLAALTRFLQPCQALVTFNGKAFDAPLLNTRYTLNGQPSPLLDLAHIDLLPLARRLWREQLPSRRLADLERDILGASRSEEDVPGWLIPSIYFDYLHSGDARPLKAVFYHNRLDVLALAALLNHMAQMLAHPLGRAVGHALELVAIAKLLESLGQFDNAAELYQQGMSRNDLPEEHYWTTQQALSFLEKRRQNWPAAVEAWQLAADGRQIYAHVELAKYYEHQARNYPEAVRWTQIALELLNRPGASRAERRQWLSDLKHRLARLQRKTNANVDEM